MTTYSVTISCTVSAYGTHSIEAETKEQAIAILKERVNADTIWDILEVEWESADDHCIVDMSDDYSDEIVLNHLYFNSTEWSEVFKD